MNTVFQYFKEGFALANRSINLFVITLVFSFILQLNELVPNNEFGLLITLFTIIVSFIGIAYSLTLPYFFTQIQANKTIDIQEASKVVLKNTVRIIRPILLLIGLFGIIGFIVIYGLHLSKEQSDMLFQKNQPWISYVYTALVALIISLFTFMSAYFSLEGDGLLVAMKKSFVAAKNHMGFVLGVFIIAILTDFIIFSTLNLPTWTSSVRTIIGDYSGFVIATSSYLYYKSKLK